MLKINQRIRQTREALKLKQMNVATEMKIGQQAYSIFEGGKKPNLESLERFCDAVKIELSFLVSDAPITIENIEKYGRKKHSEIIKEKENLEKIAYTFDRLVNSKTNPII